MGASYVHKFSSGHGGWFSDRQGAVRIWDDRANCYSPWWLDANHAPPGAGYLHMILWIYTTREWYQPEAPAAALLPYLASSFAEQGASTDLRDAKLTVRLRGEIDSHGAQLMILVQARIAATASFAAMLLTEQPIAITETWSDQTVVLANDPRHWTHLGGRHDLSHKYGRTDVAKILGDVNVDLMFVLFPVTVVPAAPGFPDPHRLVAGKDYPVDPRFLPKGLIQFESIQIDYPSR